MYGLPAIVFVAVVGVLGLVGVQYVKDYFGKESRTPGMEDGSAAPLATQRGVGVQQNDWPGIMDANPEAHYDNSRRAELALPLADEFLKAKTSDDAEAMIQLETEILEMDPTDRVDEIKGAALQTIDEELRVHLIFALGNGTTKESKEALIEIGERFRRRPRGTQVYDAVLFNLQRSLSYEDTDWLLDQVTSAEASDQKRLVLAEALVQIPNVYNVEILREAERFAASNKARAQLREYVERLESLIGL